VHLFELATFQSPGILTPPDDKAIRTLEFSPDGGRLAAGCLTGRVRVWDLRRARRHLAEFGLDWESPPPPPAPVTNPPSLRVTVAR
jgi:WD40 repeat protein